MERLFYPQQIALIGASGHPHKVGSMILQNLVKSNYQGELLLVNRNEQSVQGFPCFQDTSTLPMGIDVAIIAIPASGVAQVLEELGKKRTKYAIIISAGFREEGEEGLQREEQLQRIAQMYNIRLLGPNCLGLIHSDASSLAYNGSFAHALEKEGNVSLISQSGALISSFIDLAAERSFGFRTIVSTGNTSDLDESEILEFLLQDAKTKVIVCYLEGISYPHEFVAKIQASDKPIIVLKSGRSQKGKEAVSSHTGSIVGEAEQIDTVLTEVGALVVKNFQECVNVMHLLSRHRHVSAHKTGIVTNAGGVGVLAVDESDTYELELSEFQEKTLTELKKSLPQAASCVNPVDVLGDANEERYQAALRPLLQERYVGSVVVIITPQVMTPLARIVEDIAEMQEEVPHKPIIPLIMGGESLTQARNTCQKKQIPWFETPEQAITSLKYLYHYTHQWVNTKLWEEPTTYVKKASITKVQDRLAGIAPGHGLDFDTLGCIAQEFELPFPQYTWLTFETDMSQALRTIGRPAVLKVVSADMWHRSDQGAIETGIQQSQDIEPFLNRHGDEAVILQQQAEEGIEVFVGMKYDSNWGWFVVLGTGGIYAEIYQDFVMGTMPLTKFSIWRLLKQTKVYSILEGARGKTYDAQFVVDTIFKLHLFALSFPSLAEIDVNPLIVYPHGGVMVDFKVKTRT